MPAPSGSWKDSACAWNGWSRHRPRRQHCLYVDRVVVSSAARARGAGTLLYRGPFEFAAASSVELVTCEFDLDPPNTVSGRFHAKFGFTEAGQQRVGDGRKLVSLQVARVPG